MDNLQMIGDIVMVEPGQDKKLCLYVANDWPKKMVFEYGFTAWWTTSEGTHTCLGDTNTGNVFSMLIPRTKDRSVTLDPMSNKTIEENIVIPPGMNGLQLGCLVFNLKEPATSNIWWVFSMVVRKARILDIVIWWESVVKSSVKVLDSSWGTFTTNKRIKAEVDQDNNMKLSFLVQNDGNIVQEVMITWKIYNMLGFQKDFAVNNNIAPWATSNISVDVGILPIYKWLFNVKTNIKNNPQFSFPVSNEKLKQSGYTTENGNVFIFSRILVIAVIVVLFILYRVFFPRRIKTIIEVQRPTTV